jgi:hypothetical protein
LPDDAAIKAAIASLKPGQWLVFPPGRYIQEHSIEVHTKGVVLWGKGATIHATNPDDQAIGLMADGVSMYGFTLTAVTDIRRSLERDSRIAIFKNYVAGTGRQTGNVVRGNTIEEEAGTANQNSSASAAILIYNVEDFTVAENVVRRSLSDGIHVTGGSRNGRIVKNTVRETGDDMISVVSYLGSGWQSVYYSDATWRANATSWNGASSNVLIYGNDVAGNYWGRGITVVGGKNVSILNNKIKDTQAAAILIGQEGGYSSYGSTNILAQNNDIDGVGTTAPAYIPAGSAFDSIRAFYAAGTYTGHGAVEVYAIQDDTTTSSNPDLAALIHVQDISVSSNNVAGTKENAVRLGVSTPTNLMANVAITDNEFSNLGSSAVSVLTTVPQLACDANVLNGTDMPSQNSCPTQAPQVKNVGAQLDCDTFSL